MKNKPLIITAIILVLIIVVGFAYWYFFFNGPGAVVATPTPHQPTNGFTPLNNIPIGGTPTGSAHQSTSTPATQQVAAKIPTLRLISSTPVGGYGANTTSSTTDIRWIDRGRGNIYELDESSAAGPVTLSNTIVPRIYDSAWNPTLTAFIGSMLPDNTDQPKVIYASLVKQTAPTASKTSTSTATSSNTVTAQDVTPYQLKGSNLPANIIGYAISPKKDKVFFMTNESGVGVGYVASFDGKSVNQIFTTPLTQVNVDWPATNIIAITTKGSASYGGYLYFVNPTTGVWKKIIGPIPGLSATISHDGKYALLSATSNNQGVVTSLYNISKATGQSAIVATLADKCTWGNFYTNIVYCAVPSQPVAGTYPDDWYKGILSTVDKIWQINADTGELHLISSIVDQSDRVIDAFNLGLDQKDNYLFFMNKNDLSLWSLDLVANN